MLVSRLGCTAEELSGSNWRMLCIPIWAAARDAPRACGAREWGCQGKPRLLRGRTLTRTPKLLLLPLSWGRWWFNTANCKPKGSDANIARTRLSDSHAEMHLCSSLRCNELPYLHTTSFAINCLSLHGWQWWVRDGQGDIRAQIQPG